jgi:hypothetical protein
MHGVALLAIPVMQTEGSAHVSFPPITCLYIAAGLIGTLVGLASFTE